MSAQVGVLGTRVGAGSATGVWLHSREWDLTFILGSAALVAVPIALHHLAGLSTTAVNLLVAALVGGPHMYSTYTLTLFERRFWQRHPVLAAGSLVVPVVVVYLAITDLTLLLTLFLGWASFHVLQQVCFLTDCYRERAGEESRIAQWVDYAVVLVSLYPMAVYKLVHDQFRVEGRVLQIPFFLKGEWLVWLVAFAFAASLALWLAKTVHEARTGRLNYPKTLLIALMVAIGFVIPFFDNLDVAFQGINTWHSFQYLALIWYVNRLRAERGEISPNLMKILATGEATAEQYSARRYYAFTVALTLAAGALIWALIQTTGLSAEQCYFMVVLGSLLIHYYFDTFLFSRGGSLMRQAV